jgi:hypothetical protein
LSDKAASVDQKQNSEKWKKRTDEQNAKPTANIIMTEGDRPKKPMAGAVNSETLVAQTQERLSRALKRRYQYESNLKKYNEEHVIVGYIWLSCCTSACVKSADRGTIRKPVLAVMWSL